MRVSLYRTWRPKTFADLVGQDAVVRTLTSAIESGKLAHAYLFSGPRGSGKTSAAKILARCINCAAGPTATPDNSCEFCLAMLSGTALDVLEIDAASNRGIDEIRALRDAVKFAPSAMRMKVYIIDEAHMLTKEGANAFLKTLEEPPAHAVFLLATTEPEKLPVTILSRCQRYAFRRISIPVMIERMREIAAAEGIAIDDTALSAIAYRADGGLRDALTMLEQAASFADGAIDSATIDLAFGATGRNSARALLERALARDAAGMLAAIDDASDAGTDMQVLIRSLIAEFRNLLVGRIDPALLARDLAPEDAQLAAERARGVAQVQLVRALRLLTEALATARTSGHPRLELESALLRFVLASEDPTLDALSARVATLEMGSPLSALTVAPPPLPPVAQPKPVPKPEPEPEPEIEPER
ncbi:MAG: DNA polymerase III subunit gamma/tau, partial [Candidatus Eremiobacterales bacterium]